MGALQLPARRGRKEVGVPRGAEGRHDLRHHTRLFENFARGACLDALARLDMPLGQVPAAVAADHQPLAAPVHHHAAGRLDRREILREALESGPGIGHHDGDRIAGFEKIHYLVATYRPAVGGCEAEHLRRGSLPGEDDRFVGEINGKKRLHKKRMEKFRNKNTIIIYIFRYSIR